MSHILVVDDEPSICWGFREFLTEDGHTVDIAASAEEALRVVEVHRPDAVVLDIRLPGMDGLSAIAQLRERLGDVPVVVITAFGNLETAVRSVQEGAFDYLPKPFDLDQAAEVVARALQVRTRSTSEEAPLAGAFREHLVGASKPMQDVFKQIALAAPADVPVLITGESGTGKELVARALHQHSPRRDDPFVPVCLAALSAGLVESELFGHTRGAFTGAVENRRGLLELADGGTVFLDEIGDTTPALQVKLLRALEQQEVTPVGDARPRRINVRVVAATNRPLPEQIAAGEFREDLYFRLSVFHIRMPALRERRDDIPLLAEHFLHRIGQGGSFAPETIRELSARSWPGNVRELRNVIEHAAIVARGDTIRPEHLPAPAAGIGQMPVDRADRIAELIAEWARQHAEAAETDPAAAALFEQFLNLVEPPLLRAVLDRCGNNRAAAAQLLGIHRTTFRQKLRRYGIDPDVAGDSSG